MREIEEQKRFVIVEHSDRIVEVVYPAEPDNSVVTDYTFRIKRIIDGQNGPWMCMVDQSALKALAPRLADKIRLLNTYALRKQMVCSARVIASTAPATQSAVLSGAPGLQKVVRLFRTRGEAFVWLRATALALAEQTVGVPGAASPSPATAAAAASEPGPGRSRRQSESAD